MFSHIIKFHLMDFSSIPPLSPPEFPNEQVNIITQGDRKLKTTHGIREDCLNHWFNENFSSCLRQKFSFPFLLSLLYLLFQLIKTCSFIPPHHGEQAQIIFILLQFYNSMITHNLILHINRSGFTKKESCLVSIQSLPWDSFIGRKNLQTFDSHGW